MNLGQRIKHHRKRIGKTQTEIAELVGTSQETISTWERNVYEPSQEDINKLAAIFGVTVHDLIPLDTDTREEKNEAPGAAQDSSLTTGAGIVRIPFYDVKASAGHGCFADTEKVETYLAMQEEIIRAVLPGNPSRLAIIQASGDSMEPTIMSGEMLILDTQEKKVGVDGLYVIRLNDAIAVKRVQQISGGQVNVISDNPRYKEQHLTTEEIIVCGRVVAVASVRKA